MSDALNDYNKAISMAAQFHELERKMAMMQRSFLQTMLAIVTAMPANESTGLPEMRISHFDYTQCVGRELVSFVDPATGDTVFISRPVKGLAES